MSDLIAVMIPYVATVAGIAIFIAVTSMLIGWLCAAFTGRNDRGRFF